MTGRQENLPPRTPVMVGVGLQSQREPEPLDADEPLSLMRRACVAAARDAGAPTVLSQIDRVYVPKGRWRYRDPGRAITTSFGSPNVTSVLARVGVLQESLIADGCRNIIDGSADVCLVVGGEAGFRLLCATKLGHELHDEQQDTEADVTWRADSPIMLAPEIAARNPHAWKRSPITAESVNSDSASNPMLAFPYRSEHVSRWSVDQASALIFTSVEKARELQIDPSRWVYPLSSGVSNAMIPLSQRSAIGEAPGAEQAASAALGHAGMSADSLGLLELYSCFPIALQLHTKALGLPSGLPAPSITGGMRYAGGPFNNYVLHATAQLALALRQTGRTGLISSVSGVLTKQAFSVWSAAPPRDKFRSIDVSEAALSACPPQQRAEDYAGVASIVGYTVLATRRDRPARAVAVAEAPDGRRGIGWR